MQILGVYILREILKLEDKEEVKCSNIADKGQELLKIKDIVTEQKRSIKYKLKADTNIRFPEFSDLKSISQNIKK